MLDGRIDEAVRATDGDWRAKLRAAVRAYVSELDAEPRFARALLFEIHVAGPAAGTARDATIRRFAQRYRATFAAAGDARSVPSDDALFVLSAGIDQLVCAHMRTRRQRDRPGGRPRRHRHHPGGTMDLTFNAAEAAFRDELRAWLDAHDPGEEPTTEDAHWRWRRDWQRQLAADRWAGVHWPAEYGGRGATLTQSAIFFEELGRSGTPLPADVLGLLLAGPTLMAWGSDQQKERLLPTILDASEPWCQGFSEPDAGSDLAALKTRAVEDPDTGEWVVTGQKVWTSGAQFAKWCMLVARTDADAPRKHQGLTYFVLDMEQPGVQVVPLRQITGESEFNELFLQEARIPAENVVGGVGNGWKVAMTTLMNERSGLAFFLQVRLRRQLDKLIAQADRARPARRPGGGRAPGRAARAHRGAAPDRLPRADRDREARPARARGLADQVDVVGHQPAAHAGRRRRARRRGAHARVAVVVRAAARPRQLDRGRHHRDPQEHRRRARARPPADALNRRPTMNFDFSDDQHEIKRTARDLLASRSAFAAVRAAAESGEPDPALWRELCELGWPGIAIAEEHGGQGLGLVELGVLLEELGYAVAVTPMLGSVLAALAIEHGGDDAQRERWLPGLADGSVRGALGPADGLVPDAPGADVLVLLDADGGAQVVAAADARVEPVATIDPTRAYGRVETSAAVPLGGDAAAGIDRAAIAVSAELVGVSQRALDMTLAYVKERKQFDVPVGAFQAVSHRCAQMLLGVESARSATYFAAWTADADVDRLAEGASLAKAAASEAGRDVTASAIQAHGGIGFTWEADVHWLFKRAQLDAALLGGAGTHRARLARLVSQRVHTIDA